MLASARRQMPEALEKAKTKKPVLTYHSQVYPPYHYFLPVSPLATLNAKWRLGRVDRVKVFETKFESTSLLVAFGQDVFVTKVQPDQTFDLLSEEFNFELLGLACVAITVFYSDPDPGLRAAPPSSPFRSQEALPRRLDRLVINYCKLDLVM